jgi:hypothetical protein
MPGEVWMATAIGVGGGFGLTYAVGKFALPHLVLKSRDNLLAARLALAGALVAFLPAIALSFVVGATLGGAWGGYLTGQLGFGATGMPLGLAAGIALVFSGVLLCGMFGGVLIARAIIRFRK